MSEQKTKQKKQITADDIAPAIDCLATEAYEQGKTLEEYDGKLDEYERAEAEQNKRLDKHDSVLETHERRIGDLEQCVDEGPPTPPFIAVYGAGEPSKPELIQHYIKQLRKYTGLNRYNSLIFTVKACESRGIEPAEVGLQYRSWQEVREEAKKYSDQKISLSALLT